MYICSHNGGTHTDREDKGRAWFCKEICNLCGAVIRTWLEDKY